MLADSVSVEHTLDIYEFDYVKCSCSISAALCYSMEYHTFVIIILIIMMSIWPSFL